MAITRIQAWKDTVNNGGPPTSCAYTSSLTSGSLLVAVLSYFGDSSQNVTAMSDTLNGSWTQAVLRKNTSQDKVVGIYYFAGSAAGASTVSFSTGGTPSNPTLSIVELGGALTVNPLDQTSNAIAASGIPDYGSVTPSQDNEIVIGACCGATSAGTADTGFVVRIDTNADGQQIVCDEIQGTATTRATFLTAPNLAGGWAAVAATFLAAGLAPAIITSSLAVNPVPMRPGPGGFTLGPVSQQSTGTPASPGSIATNAPLPLVMSIPMRQGPGGFTRGTPSAQATSPPSLVFKAASNAPPPLKMAIPMRPGPGGLQRGTPVTQSTISPPAVVVTPTGVKPRVRRIGLGLGLGGSGAS